MSIHSTAVIHEGAVIGADCDIGPYCVIGEHVALGRGCKLHSHVILDGHTEIGDENQIYPFASVGLRSQDLKWDGGTTWTRIGHRNTIREYTTIHSATGDGDATVIGDDNNFLAYSHVAHDCHIGNHVIMSNVGTLAGHVIVEDRAIIGGLAAIHQFCRVGTMAFIGGCSKVVQDAPPYMIIDGNPAGTRTLNKEGLKRNSVSEESQQALKQAYRMIFRGELSVKNAAEKAGAEFSGCMEVGNLVEFIRASERGIAC